MDGLVEEGWREERRGRMLAAASRIFALRAFDAVSMDEIAQEAGVGKPTLYRYFESKEELFSEAFVAALDDLELRLTRVIGRADPVEVRIRDLVREIIPTFHDHLVSPRMMGDTTGFADRSKRRIFRERRARIGRAFAVVIEAGARDGDVREVDGEAIAQLVIGMIWSAAATGMPDADATASIADLVLHGILVRRGPAIAAGRLSAESPAHPIRGPISRATT